MPNRYFQSDPGLVGALQFLAGFGQANRETQIANAQLRGQQNQLLGTGIGRGVSNLFSVPATMFLEDLQMGRQMQQRGQLQQQEYDLSRRNQQALEQSRTQNDIFQAGVANYIKQYGDLPPMSAEAVQRRFGGFAPSMEGPQIPMTPGEYGMSLPEQGISQTFPEQQPPPQIDRSKTRGYIQAEQEVMQLNDAYESLERNSYIAPDQRTATMAAIARELGPRQAYLNKHPKPKPPATHEQIIAAGPLSGGAAPIPGTYNYWIPDGKGGTKVSTAVHPVSELAAPPVTFTAVDGSAQTIDVPAGGVHFTSPPPPGTAIKRNAKGDPDIEWPPSAKTDGDGNGFKWDSTAEFHKARAELVQEQSKFIPSAGNRNPPPITADAVRKRMSETKQALEESMKEPALEALLQRASELLTMSYQGDLSIQQVEQWKGNVIDTFGSNTDQWPSGLLETWKHVAANAGPLYQNMLTIE